MVIIHCLELTDLKTTMDHKKSEKDPLLNKGKDITSKQPQIQVDSFQIWIRIFLTLTFTLSRELVKLSLKQYIYRWIQDHHSSNETDSVGDEHLNSSLNSQCGHNLTAEAEKDDQKEASTWTMYFSFTEYGLAFLTMGLYGVLSDNIGRKPLMLISCVGYFFRFCIMSVIVYFGWHMSYFFIAYGVSGICGGHYTFSLSLVASVADKTGRNKQRSIGLAIVELLLGFAASLSQIATGYLIKDAGYFYPVVISTGLVIITLTLTICFVTETIERTSTVNLTCRVGLKRIFGFYYDKSTILNGKRWQFNINVIAFIFVYLLHVAPTNFDTLYQMRSPFCWTSETIGWFGFTKYMLQYVVSAGIMKILQRCLKDEVICIFGCISFIAFMIIEGLASTSLMLYIAAGSGILCGLPISIMRFMCSRLCSADLQGALFANLYVLENACHLSSSVIFNNLYGLTQSFMPGLAFIIIGAGYIIPVVLVSIVTISSDHQQSVTLLVNEKNC